MSYIIQRTIGQTDWFYGIPPKNPADVPNYNDPGTATPEEVAATLAAQEAKRQEAQQYNAQVAAAQQPVASAPPTDIAPPPADALPPPTAEMEDEGEYADDGLLPPWVDKKTVLIAAGVVGAGLFLWAIL